MENKYEKIFLKYCDLKCDVGDKTIEEINVISYECFEEVVDEILSERLQSENNSNNDRK